jgi:hypothetical protein
MAVTRMDIRLAKNLSNIRAEYAELFSGHGTFLPN